MILLTGFEPFGTEATNPSWLAARRATSLLREQGLDATAVEVPCVFGRSVDALAEAIGSRRGERAHPYWSDLQPCSMLIEEVEAIWAAIATGDDWAPFEAKVAAIRRMGEALGEA